MIEKLDSVSSHLELIFTSKDGHTIWKRDKKVRKKIEGLKSEVNILPGSVSFPKFLPKKAKYIFREIYHFLFTYRSYWKIKPDIIYVDNANVFTACILSRITSTPVIFRVMGVYPSMKKIIYSKSFIDKILKYCYSSPFRQVICTQDGSGVEPWLNKIINKKTKIDILINGVEKFTPSKKISDIFNRVDLKKTIILYIGKFEESKGCIQFLKAFNKAYRNIGKEIQGLMIGSGSKEKELVKISSELGLKNNLIFINRLPHHLVLQAHQISDIYVSLNRYGNLSNANLEAMKFGQAMIFPKSQKKTHIDVILDDLLDDKCVLRIESSDDIDGLANSIIHLFNNPSNRIELSNKIKKSAEHFITDWQKRIDMELKIISELL